MSKSGQPASNSEYNHLTGPVVGGYPDEWQLHHQGGPASYAPRDYLATPASAEIVVTNQVYAWNPSIAGIKSENTILIGSAANEVLTVIEDWPTYEVRIDGGRVHRPAILEVN
jgi:antitoxin VapB